MAVSTHSRPKAAGTIIVIAYLFNSCFNSQPPEGGWFGPYDLAIRCKRFNSQPPEGGWAGFALRHAVHTVSTHSRPKAAGDYDKVEQYLNQRFNSQPPEGGWPRW